MSLTSALLSGCAQAPAPLPDPPPVVVIDCRTPEDMLEAAAEPTPPSGDYTQRDVARYVVQLAGWGRAGWTRVMSARQFANECERGADGGS